MNPFYHQKHFKRFLSIFLFSSFLFLFKSCFFYKKVSIYDFPAYEIPPNGVEISDKLFYDETEVSNLNWLEYEYWMKRKYGENSIEYKSTFIQTKIWVTYDSTLSSYDTFYLRHPAYRDFSVTGITQQQAKNFTKWREDRVLEVLLVKHDILPIDTGQFVDKIFTVEKYFKGEYNNLKPDTNIKFYVEFRLPTIEERKLALHYTDSVNKEYFKRCYTIRCKKCREYGDSSGVYFFKKSLSEFDIGPTRDVYSDFIPVKVNSLFNIRGNVSEWLAEENICGGGSWIDSRERILKNDTFHVDGAKVWVGFRNVAEWKSVDSLLNELGIERK